jgi:hypothetical protein
MTYQNEIEAILARNIGNRLTHELASGMLAAVLQAVEQALASARAEVAQGPYEGSEATPPQPAGTGLRRRNAAAARKQ